MTSFNIEEDMEHNGIDLSSHRFLEEIEGCDALRWVNKQNEKTQTVLESEKLDVLKTGIYNILNTTNRLPYAFFHNKSLYNFWQDKKNPKGLLRRTTFSEYLKPALIWENILDIDYLSEKEGKNWVYKGKKTLSGSDLIMVELSEGGKDASVHREYNLKTKEFVHDGFSLPEAKGFLEWVNSDMLIVGINLATKSIDHSGYSGSLSILRRGDVSFSAAEKLISIPKEDAYIKPARVGGNIIIEHYLNFFEKKIYILNDDLEYKKLDLPSKIDVVGACQNYLIVKLKEDWMGFDTDSLICVYIKGEEARDSRPKLFFKPENRVNIEDVFITKGSVLVHVLSDVKSKIIEIKKINDNFEYAELKLPSAGSVISVMADEHESNALITVEGFLRPPVMYLYADDNKNLKIVKSIPDKFDSTQYEVSQYWVKSTDAIEIPYFVIQNKNTLFNGKNPTIVYAYGGFEVSLVPEYLESVEYAWLSKGGVYVIANIRGGGEFGAKWHESALKGNRHKAHGDFFAIAEDLIERKITSEQYLGIRGASNGGLLMGVAFTQRPDLFQAVLLERPLIDMLEYHKYLAGSMWIAEYGSSDDPEMRLILLAYSPYHNVKKEITYPEVLLITSMKDDRVHPLHGRKMGKLLEDLDKPFLYFETRDSGHSSGVDFEQVAQNEALAYSYFHQKLM